MEKKKIVFTVAFMMLVCHVFADRYKVLYVNSPGIKIETKNAVVGLVFSDKDKIVWASDQQAMKVVNLNTNRAMVLAAKALKKKNASSLYDYLTSTRRLSTRNLKRNRTTELWQIDSTLYLLDTLYVSRPQTSKRNVVAFFADIKGNKRNLSITEDGHYYVITRNQFRDNEAYPIKLSIMEYDEEKKWEYVVFRNLIIEQVKY